MTFEDYKLETTNDAMEYIGANYVNYSDFESLFDDLFIEDSVTGNGSGSYTFNAAMAAENVSQAIWDDEIIGYFEDWGYKGIPTEKGPEAIDVIIRCIALDVIRDELEEYYDELSDRAWERSGD